MIFQAGNVDESVSLFNFKEEKTDKKKGRFDPTI